MSASSKVTSVSAAKTASNHSSAASRAGTAEIRSAQAGSQVSGTASGRGGASPRKGHGAQRPHTAAAPSKAPSELSVRMSAGGGAGSPTESAWGIFVSAAPTGPFVHGEDLRYVRPKKRGGIAKMSGIKALHPSGRLMGSDVQAWWPDPPVEDDESDAWTTRSGIAKPRFKSVMQTSPFAVGKTMDTFDRRTFNPRLSGAEWQESVKQLQMASTKLSEMERSMRCGLQLMAAASQAASMATSKHSQSSAPSFLSSTPSQAKSKTSQATSQASSAQSALTARSYAEELKLHGLHTGTIGWMSPQLSARARQIPDYSKVVKAERFGDHALRSMRDFRAVKQQQEWRDNPPEKTWPKIRPFETVTAKYIDSGGAYMLREKKIYVDPKTISHVGSPSVKSNKSGGSGTRQDPLGPGPAVAREVVDECGAKLGRAMTPKRREETLGAQVWNKFKGEHDPVQFRTTRVSVGRDEQQLLQNGGRRPNTASAHSRSSAGASVASGPRRSQGGSPLAARVSTAGKKERKEHGPFQEALASAGLAVGNPLLTDSNVKIRYQL